MLWKIIKKLAVRSFENIKIVLKVTESETDVSDLRLKK